MSETSTDTRLTASRFVEAPASDIFAVLRDPEGHIDIEPPGCCRPPPGPR